MVNKALGQHWLNNRAILDEIARLAGEGAVCLEIGPGLGTLTASLLKRFSKVIAVEFDADLARKLPGSFPGKNLEVINEDILRFDFSGMTTPYAVAGNIPYYITSPIVEKMLTVQPRPERIVLLMQKEVAERIADTKKRSLIGLKCQNLADVELGPVVPASEFTPPPKVDSQVLVLTPHVALVPDEVIELAKIGFLAPRKKLIHNLARLKPKAELVRILTEAGIDLNARPHEISLDDWHKIYKNMV